MAAIGEGTKVHVGVQEQDGGVGVSRGKQLQAQGTSNWAWLIRASSCAFELSP